MYVISLHKLTVAIDRNRHTLAQGDFAKELEAAAPASLARNFQVVLAASVEEGVRMLAADVQRQYASSLQRLNLSGADLRMHVREQKAEDGRFWDGSGLVRGNPYNVATGKLA